MRDLVCSVDMGTSRIKAALVDDRGELVALEDAPAPVDGEGGGLQFDAEAHFRIACGLIRAALEHGVADARILAVAVTNQRATVVPVDRNGHASAPAISWQDTRCDQAVHRFMTSFGAPRFHALTGLPAGSLWSLGKILWLMEKEPGKVDGYVLLHDYVLGRLGAENRVTDVSNASLTGLLDLRRGCWSEEILEAAGIDASRLPRLVPCGSLVGKISSAAATATGLAPDTALIAGGGDQQCAALGAGVLDAGDAGLCLGTAAVLVCPSDHPITDAAGLFCTAHVVPDRWLLEGIHNAFGASVKWLIDLLRIEDSDELDRLILSTPPGAGGVTFLPFLSGIGSPDYDARARAAFFGLDSSCDRPSIARAVLEGIVLEVRRILDAMRRHQAVRRIILSGGQAGRESISRLTAEVTGLELNVTETVETTLLGAAALAWTGVGRFPSPSAAARALASPSVKRIAVVEASNYDKIYQSYLECIARVRTGGGPHA